MWIRVTCSNGHKLHIEKRFLGRSNRCPKCQSLIYLWIRTTCPNGHTAKVKSKHCGKTGRCPTCQVEVTVPDLLDALAMDILETDNQPQSPADSSQAANTLSQRAVEITRICPGCNAEVAKSYRSCPLCNKFLGDPQVAAELSKTAGGGPGSVAPQRVLRCPECGATSFPGDAYCSTCGATLAGKEEG